MIRKLSFLGGPSAGASPTEIQLTSVLILVGPNNSGKSLALKEIENLARGMKSKGQVVGGCTLETPKTVEGYLKLVQPFLTVTHAPDGENVYQVRTSQLGQDANTNAIRETQLLQLVSQENHRALRQWAFSPLVIRLAGRNRFNLVDEQRMPTLKGAPDNHLWSLFKNTGARERVRKLSKEALGLHFVLDPLKLGSVSIRMAHAPPPLKYRESSIHSTSAEYMEAASPIAETGDGVQAYTGITAMLESSGFRIMLLDEPEAFLHPPLAARLGREVVDRAKVYDGTLVASTHSADFLLGCLSSTADLVVCRLTYEQRTATARALAGVDIRDFLTDPLLRNIGVASALFHRGAVVCESDYDRTFYAEVDRRLRDAGRGAPETVFLNAQNWQTIDRVVRGLRILGVPAAAVMDLDAVTGNATEWKRLLEAVGFPKRQWKRVLRERLNLRKALQAIPRQSGKAAAIKEGGIQLLSGKDRREAERLLKYMRRYGLFLVPTGEVETWLGELRIQERKAKWLAKVFERAGTFDDDPAILTPGSGDVWDFIDDVGSWIGNPERRGMPA